MHRTLIMVLGLLVVSACGPAELVDGGRGDAGTVADRGSPVDVTTAQADAADVAAADVDASSVDVGPQDAGRDARPNCIDNDGDGYGSGLGCIDSDCDDSNPLAYRGAMERCDGVDNNCDGRADVAGDPEVTRLDDYCRRTAPATLAGYPILACALPGRNFGMVMLGFPTHSSAVCEACNMTAAPRCECWRADDGVALPCAEFP